MAFPIIEINAGFRQALENLEMPWNSSLSWKNPGISLLALEKCAETLEF